MDGEVVLQSENGRVQWVDVSRAIAILLVILGHFEGLGLLSVWIYSFHLPVFFFLSGFLSKNNSTPFVFLKKKAKTLLIPYAFLAVGIICFSIAVAIFKNEFSFSFLGSLVLSYCIQRRQGTLWFLACLFFLEIIFYFISKYLNKYLLLACNVLMPVFGYLYIHFGGPALPWNIDVCLMAIPFYYIGYLTKKYKVIDFLLSNKWKTVLILATSIICNIGFCILNRSLCGGRVDMFASSYGIYPIMFLSAIGGIVAIIIIATMIKSNVMSHIGKNSLIYFGWHQRIFIPISSAIVSKLSGYMGFSNIWFSFLSFLLTLLFCAVVENIINRTKLRVLIGKF